MSGAPCRVEHVASRPELGKRQEKAGESGQMRILRRSLGWLACAALVAASVGAFAATPQEEAEWARKYPPDAEQRVGKPIVDEADRTYGVVDDPAETQHVAEMVQEIAAVSDRPDVQYDVKIINSDEPNAFAVPGGYVRVTRGLLDMVQSDDELAGVLAHEIAHNCLYHGLRQMDRDKNLQQKQMILLIAALIFGRPQDIAPVDLTLAVMRANILFGYSRDYESQADHNGLEYLLRTKYNPTGFLTFMERLAAYESRYPILPADQRTFDTHPPSEERVAEILKILHDKGITINRALVLRGFTATVSSAEVEEGVRVWNVKFSDRVIFQPASLPDGTSAEQRAGPIADKINEMVAARGIDTAVIGLQKRQDQYAITLFGRSVILIEPEDARAAGMSENDYASMVRDAFIQAVWEANLNARGTLS